MRKIMIAAMAAFCFVNANAQFEKGSKWIGGSTNIGYNKTETQNSGTSFNGNNLSFGIRPSFNCFKSDKVMNTFFIGYGLSLSKSENNSGNINKSHTHNFVIGVSRSYINPLFGKVYSSITTGFAGIYGFQKDESTSSFGTTSQTKAHSYGGNINIGLGLLYRVTDRFAVSTSINNFLNGSIYYRTEKTTTTGSPDNTVKSIGLDGSCGLSGFSLGSLQFGLMYRLKK